MIPKNFLLIAIRYLQTKQKNSALKSMIKVCILGIFIATCALALVVSVMQGFETATHEKMQSIYPDLIIDSHNQSLNMDKLGPILESPNYQIASYSEQYTAQALLYNDEYEQAPTVICLKGVNPAKESTISKLEQKIVKSSEKNLLANIIHDDQILIGNKLAQNLNSSLHDTLQLLYTDEEPEQLHVTFQKKKVTVGGIFKTGIDEYDSNIAYCSIKLFQQLFPDNRITQVHIKLYDKKDASETIAQLKSRLHVDVYSWKELYPALVSALKLEKYAMFFILLLIVIIASMNIISVIFMFITKKNKDIAVLLCFGMSTFKIKLIFITISLLITIFATSTGLLTAYLIGRIIQKYPCISLPDDAYLLTHLPIQLDPLIFCVIFISSILITLIASIVSIRHINDINIVQILKQE